MSGFFDGFAVTIGRFWAAACNPLIFVLAVICLTGEIIYICRIPRRALPVMGQAMAGQPLDETQKASIRRILTHCQQWRSFLLSVLPLFPQAGILGTVAALLLELAENSGVSTDNVNLRFALSSTLYGLAAAMMLKIVDIFLAHRMERVMREMEEPLEREIEWV